MARFTPDPNRLNFTVTESGREYNLRLLQRAQAIFSGLLNLLPSSYISAVQGPNYTNELKAVAVELAKFELAVEDVDRDRDFSTTRGEFLYSIAGYLLLTNGRLPPLEFSDEEFRKFLAALIGIYFQGSIPKSMSDVIRLLLSGDVTVSEDFILVRKQATGLDISDEFTFTLDVVAPPGGGFPANVMTVEETIRQLLDIVRPAHTLFRIRYIFQDKYVPNDALAKIEDSMKWAMTAYWYDDFRAYWAGLRDRDRLGRKSNEVVTAEDHSTDF